MLSCLSLTMNGLCSACRQPVEVLDFRLDEGLVVVRCTACGQQQRLSLSEATGVPPSAPAAAGPAPVSLAPAAPSTAAAATKVPSGIEVSLEPPPGFCRKCIAPRLPAATACPACGLVFATASASGFMPSAAMATAWRALAVRWGEAAEHVRFLQRAAAGGELAAAGRLYRIRLAQVPTDAQARGSLETAIKMASAPVTVAAHRQAASAEEPPRRRTKLVMMGLMLLGPTLVFALIRLLGRH